MLLCHSLARFGIEFEFELVLLSQTSNTCVSVRLLSLLFFCHTALSCRRPAVAAIPCVHRLLLAPRVIEVFSYITGHLVSFVVEARGGVVVEGRAGRSVRCCVLSHLALVRRPCLGCRPRAARVARGLAVLLWVL